MSCGSSLRSSARQYRDRKSTRLNSSHSSISYAVFCLKKKIKKSNHNNAFNILYSASSMTRHTNDSIILCASSNCFTVFLIYLLVQFSLLLDNLVHYYL